MVIPSLLDTWKSEDLKGEGEALAGGGERHLPDSQN